MMAEAKRDEIASLPPPFSSHGTFPLPPLLCMREKEGGRRIWEICELRRRQNSRLAASTTSHFPLVLTLSTTKRSISPLLVM